MPESACLASDTDLQSFNTLALRARARTVLELVDLAQVPDLPTGGAGSFVLGGGSNVVLPEMLAKPVVRVALRGIRVLSRDDDAVAVEVAAGESWHGFVAWCVAQGFGGLENLALIPGSVGAAPVQNIGAYGLEVGERIESLTAYDFATGAWSVFRANDCGFAYRDSVFKRMPGRWLITAVRFRLPSQWQPRLDYPDLAPLAAAGAPTPKTVFDTVCAVRRAKLPDPATLPNAGSFFKNPSVSQAEHTALAGANPRMPAWPQADGRVKLAAAWLIEQAGWKGRRLGPVGMHERHALVLVNYGGASASDVRTLAAAVVRDVKARFGVVLEQEPVTP